MNASLGTRRANLAETVIQELSSRIDNGTYGPGDKLPSEQALCKEFNVSRPVVREAVASLRLGGRLIARQGVGVFVVEQDVKRIGFAIDSIVDDVRAAAQILELRLGIETESVARAAERRSPASMAAITEAFDRFNTLDGASQEEEAKADFEFHLAIARATQNPHFTQLLEALGPDIILDLNLKHGQVTGKNRQAHIKKIGREHGAILSAISMGDVSGARTALRKHLEESLSRYQRLLDSKP
ncbi:FadR family transcriptional regulator [Pseudomonas sp. S75]|uniref:FadR/GntR family transcriptional regulator n=1 Tax=unclassified Pseudomonas TaxID=196821 RepID=UPI0019073D4C|nr:MULTISPECIES: FadR/GntR family transcriptional regulator [unclassified Pseudomonas]MBJ9976341.1 FadR family transcriptional regulator [Pseudomonas sp. S30]MBK0154547.1 FadR family transcriptional regulator [Pseudomonas sp. S75]